MEKIYLKPVSQEILIKGATAEGHLDVFSYDPADQSSGKLGSIFIIGHVHHETDDVAYSINLIASLAKREYYAKPNLTPREAFSATLKKINEVVEDFFENEGLTLNIGIFAMAGEQIFLSKLGKFKLLLARENRAIDVLNNVDLFDKEVTEERQFSSIISGKVTENDRILAFYPTRSMTAREKYFKTDLLSLPGAEFVKKINAIKQEKDTFACAALYVDLKKVREIASTPRVAPQPSPVSLASVPKVPINASKKRDRGSSISQSNQEDLGEIGKKPVYATPAAVQPEPQPYMSTEQEVPHIIPSEFSLGRKGNVFSSAWHRIRFINLTPRNKAILSFGLAALIITASFAVKAIFVPSPEAQQLKQAIENARTSINLARTKVSQKDFSGARSTLSASLAAIGSLNAADASDAEPVRDELTAILDELDQAQEVSPAFVAQVPAEYGKASLLASGDMTYVYAYNSEAKSGIIAKVHNGSISDESTTPELNGALMFTGIDSASVIDTASQTIVTWGTEKAKAVSLPTPANLVSMDLYEDNLYILSTDAINRAIDAAKGGSTLKPWLATGESIIADPALIAVDGDIFILSKSGILATYYKGKKQSEISTGLVITDKQLLLTTNDATSLYLVDKEMRRIYIIDKKTGTLSRTLKVDSNEPFLAAAVDNTGSVYFTTSDNKIWKVQ